MEKSNQNDVLIDSTTLERYFHSATFNISAPTLKECPHLDQPEVAFAGRSNAGKSSAINCIVSQKKLARTSKTPGRTQLLNFFVLNDDCALTDLPGYGYAKVAVSKKNEWQKELEHYLEHRNSLAALVLLVDSRLPLQDYDKLMIDWCTHYQLPCHVMLTKADKLSKNKANSALLKLKNSYKNNNLITFQLFSSLNKTGVDQARRQIYTHLHPTTDPEASDDEG